MNFFLKGCDLAYRWKMQFNPDANKQALDVVFSEKLENKMHSQIFFNNSPVARSNFLKHVGVYLETKIDCTYVKEKMKKAIKGVNIIIKLHPILPMHSLLTIYKFKPHLSCGDVSYNQPNNEVFCKNTESLQYQASFANTGQSKAHHEINL